MRGSGPANASARALSCNSRRYRRRTGSSSGRRGTHRGRCSAGSTARRPCRTAGRCRPTCLEARGSRCRSRTAASKWPARRSRPSTSRRGRTPTARCRGCRPRRWGTPHPRCGHTSRSDRPGGSTRACRRTGGRCRRSRWDSPRWWRTRGTAWRSRRCSPSGKCRTSPRCCTCRPRSGAWVGDRGPRCTTPRRSIACRRRRS